MDRLEQHRLALGQRLLDGEPAGRAERDLGGVDRMVGAVEQRRLDIDHREAERPLHQRVAHAIFDGAEILPWHHAAMDLLVELHARAARAGRISITTSPNWPWPPDCFLCLPRWVDEPRMVSR